MFEPHTLPYWLGGLALLVFILSGLRIAQEYQRAVVFRLGRFHSVRGPGLYYNLPLLEWQQRVDMRTITVNVEPDETKALQEEWDRRDIPVPLKALDSPYREITRPVVEYVKSLRSGHPRDVVVVYIPEYVLGKWYEQVLHNQSALQLKLAMLRREDTVVTSVPYHVEAAVSESRSTNR